MGPKADRCLRRTDSLSSHPRTTDSCINILRFKSKDTRPGGNYWSNALHYAILNAPLSLGRTTLLSGGEMEIRHRLHLLLKGTDCGILLTTCITTIVIFSQSLSDATLALKLSVWPNTACTKPKRQLHNISIATQTPHRQVFKPRDPRCKPIQIVYRGI